jgi:hypothetical protein
MATPPGTCIAPFPDLPPKVGFAKTVTMRAKDQVTLIGEG